MKSRQITFEIIDKVARIGFGKYSKKPLTTLELETLEELGPILKEIEKKQKEDITGLVFFSHKKNVFLAGMNVKVISDLETVQNGIDGAKQGQEICSQIEDLEIPTIACVEGVCMGGGSELALACKIIAVSDSPNTKLGFPEVLLGLLPAFGGSYRLPRKTGLPAALDLMLSGRMINGETAKKMGLVDQIYPGDNLVEMAIADYIIDCKKTGRLEDTAGNNTFNDPVDNKFIFKEARKSVLKGTGGHYKIPLLILDHLESSYGKSRTDYLHNEALLLGEIAISRESRNLQNIHYLHVNSQKYRGPASDKEKLILKKGAVVGAGTMGSGIAWLMARNNMTPIMKDINETGLESGIEQAAAFFIDLIKRKKISEDESKRKQGSIRAQQNYNGFENIDLVFEAVFEEIGIKKDVLSEVEKEVSEDCLITSGTSSISINEMASVFSRPERFAGLHFFRSINRAPLLEIITHDQIAPSTVFALYKWAVKMKKIPVIVKDSPGFLVNRILASFINEGLYLLEEGVPVDELEQACLNFGMPVGPGHLLDDIGIDIVYRIINVINKTHGDRFKPAAVFGKLSGFNYYGVKSKKGFYHYNDRGIKTGMNEEVLQLLPARKIKMREKDIQKRVIIPMINEAAYVLQDRIAETVEDIDLALVFGTGFPRFRGGLLKYADTLGLDNVLQALDHYAEDLDTKRFKACSLIEELAEKDGSFYNINR